jgi:hypothetical protein
MSALPWYLGRVRVHGKKKGERSLEINALLRLFARLHLSPPTWQPHRQEMDAETESRGKKQLFPYQDIDEPPFLHPLVGHLITLHSSSRGCYCRVPRAIALLCNARIIVTRDGEIRKGGRAASRTLHPICKSNNI